MSHLCTPEQHVAPVAADAIPFLGLELESADPLQDEIIET